ncbi:MAG TPA: hypothetical protein ENI27_04345 [bacterium]|nr:hypothetical protein [bacterium]
MTHFLDYSRKKAEMPESTKILIKSIEEKISKTEREIREFEKIVGNKEKYTPKQRIGVKKLLAPAKSKIKGHLGIIKTLESGYERTD